LNWSEILKAGGVPEPPGYLETIEWLKQHPYAERQAARAAKKAPKKRPKKSS
jgi:hypothetical protein